jgi:MFS family permease
MSTVEPVATSVEESSIDQRQRIARLTFYFGLVYFCQGVSQIVCLLNQPVRYFLRKGHGYDADQIAYFMFVAQLPWVIKPLYGLISDFIPLFGYRRKSYLLLMNLLAAGAFLYVTGVTKPAHVLVALTLTGVGVAAADVIVDALMVEAGQETGRVRLFQGVQWLCINIAGIGAGFLGGWICGNRTPDGAIRLACLISAIPPIVVAAMTWWAVRERRVPMNLPQLKSTAGGFIAAFTSGRLWAVAGFLILINLNPGLITPLYTHLEENLKLDESFLGNLDAYQSIGMSVGSAIFLLFMTRRFSTRTCIAIGLVTLSACAVPYFFVYDKTSTSWAYGVYGVGYMIASLATLSLAAEACPKRAEGFVFAGLMSLINVSVQYSDWVGSKLYVGHYQRHIAPLIGWSIALTAAGLLIVPFLPTARVPDQEERPPKRGFEVVQ